MFSKVTFLCCHVTTVWTLNFSDICYFIKKIKVLITRNRSEAEAVSSSFLYRVVVRPQCATGLLSVIRVHVAHALPPARQLQARHEATRVVGDGVGARDLQQLSTKFRNNYTKFGRNFFDSSKYLLTRGRG